MVVPTGTTNAFYSPYDAWGNPMGTTLVFSSIDDAMLNMRMSRPVKAEWKLDNQAEEQRKSMEENHRMLLMFLCIILVFFSVAVGMIVSSVTRQLHNEGRTIGMLRAVGADERAILGCYSGQLNAAILGGLGVTGAVYLLFLIFSALDAIGNPFFRIRLADILQWAAVIGLKISQLP